MYERVDDRAAIAKTPVDTKSIDTNKAFEGEPKQIRSRSAAENFKLEMDQICMEGLPPLEVRGNNLYCSEAHANNFNHVHRHVTCVFFHAKAQILVLVRLPVEDGTGVDAGKFFIVEQEHATHDAAGNSQRDWREHLSGGEHLGLSSRSLFRHARHIVSGMMHGETSWSRGRQTGSQISRAKVAVAYPNQNRSHQSWVTGMHRRLKQKIARGESEEWCISTCSNLLTCS